MTNRWAGLCFAMVLSLTVSTLMPEVSRAQDVQEKTQEEIKAEKDALNGQVERAKIGLEETAAGRTETEAKIKELEQQPTPEQVGKELNRPQEPKITDYPNGREYNKAHAAWKKLSKEWEKGLSEEDLKRWKKALDDADNLTRKRSQLKRWAAAVELHETRLKRIEAERNTHCTEFPLNEEPK